MVYFLGRDCEVYITVEQPLATNVEGVFIVNTEPTYLTTNQEDGAVDYEFALPLGSGTSVGAVANLVGVDLSIGAMDEDITYFGMRSVTKAEIKKETTLSITRKKTDPAWDAVFNGARYGITSTAFQFVSGNAEPTVTDGYRLHVVLQSGTTGAEVFTICNACIQSHSTSINADGTGEETLEFMSYVDPLMGTTAVGTSSGEGLYPTPAADL